MNTLAGFASRLPSQNSHSRAVTWNQLGGRHGPADEFRELPVGDRELGNVESAQSDLPHRTFAIGRESFGGLAAHVEAGGIQADHIFKRSGGSAWALGGRTDGDGQLREALLAGHAAGGRRIGRHVTRRWPVPGPPNGYRRGSATPRLRGDRLGAGSVTRGRVRYPRALLHR